MCPLSVVVVVVIVGVFVNFSLFHFHLQNHWANFNQTLHMHPWLKGIQFCLNEKPRPFLRGDNQEIVKIHWRNLKIFFSRTTGPISTKLGTKYLWDKGIKLCSNEGPWPFPWVDNYEIAKISWRKFKNLLQNQRANFNQSWHNASLGEKDSSLFKWRTIHFS